MQTAFFEHDAFQCGYRTPGQIMSGVACIAEGADVPDITTISVGEPDFTATQLGGKAVGELGVVRVAAAIGNAIYHATARRVRDLPITMEKLLV